MRTIYEIKHGFLGETAEIEAGQPAPAGWTFTPPPKVTKTKAASWQGGARSGMSVNGGFFSKAKWSIRCISRIPAG